MPAVRKWQCKCFFTSESSYAVELAPFFLVYADLKRKLLIDSLCLICPFIFYGYILVQPTGLFRHILHSQKYPTLAAEYIAMKNQEFWMEKNIKTLNSF